jgi:hypothetical protein
MSRIAAQNSANIKEEQWVAFEERFEKYHPDESYTADMRQFIGQLSIDGRMKADARVAFTFMRDEWCALLPQESVADTVPFNSLPTKVRIDRFQAMFGTLCRNLEARQESLPLNKPLTDGQELFKFLEFDEDSLPMSLMIDIGVCLGFRYQPMSNSWLHAGKAFLLAQMCRTLFADLHPGAADELPQFEGGELGNDHESMPEMEGEEAGAQEPAAGNILHTFVPNNLHSNKLKLCVHAVWHTHYLTAKWSPGMMVGAWLKEGMEEFSTRLGMKYDRACFPNIVSTAGGWIDSLVANAKTNSPQPSGEWFDTLRGTQAARKEWIAHFAVRLVKTKIEAPKTAKQLSIGEGQSASAAGRKRKLIAITDTAETAADTTDTANTAAAAAAAAAAAHTAVARTVTPAVPAARATANTPRPAPAVTPAACASNVIGSAYGLQERLRAQADEDDRLLREAHTESVRQHNEVMGALKAMTNSITDGVREGLKEIAKGFFANAHPQPPYYQAHYAPHTAPPPAHTAYGSPSPVFRLDNGSS